MIGRTRQTYGSSDSKAPRAAGVRLLRAVSVPAAALALTLIAHHAQTNEAYLAGYRVALADEFLIYGKLLLLASALCYSLHLWFTSLTVGKWATGLAVAALTEILTGLLLHWQILSEPAPIGVWTSAGPTLTLGLVVCLLTYLAMEAAYRTRSAGAMVVPAVAIVAMLQPPLSHAALLADAASVAKLYCHYACVAATVIGYALLASGAVFAAVRLAATRKQVRRILGPGRNKRHVEHLLVGANVLGFAVLLLAALLWESITRSSISLTAFMSAIEPWVLAVLFIYAGHLLLHYITRSSGARTAFWALTNFCATLLGLGLVMLQ